MNPIGILWCLGTRFAVLNKIISNNGLNELALSQFHSRKLHIYRNLLAKISFNLSDIGEGIREVVVKEWYVKVGDKVKQFDDICEVQSDKASVTITSRYDGTISKLYYDIDQIALVGKPLIDVETDNEEIQSGVSENSIEEATHPVETNTEIGKQLDDAVLNKTVAEEIPSSNKPTEESTPDNEITGLLSDIFKNRSTNETLCIPSVRRLAKEHAIDLSQVTGTGKSGRILKEDILHYMKQSASAERPSTTMMLFDKKEKLTSFQKAMVKTMTESSKIPQFLYGDEIEVSKLSELRNMLRTTQSVKVSILPFFVKAISNALLKYPILNSSLDEQCDNIIYHKSHNIGIAVDTVQGLAVPVIKNVQEMGVVDISLEIQRLLKSGKAGAFSPSDLIGGTFTVSNIGSIGGTYTKPLILPPQSAILAIGASQIIPRFDEHRNVIPSEIVNISASGDHRIIDGATMARFLITFKRQIESPYLLLLNI